MLYPSGTIVNCNRCDLEFRANKSIEAEFGSDSAVTRVDTFLECPNCHQSDSHWLHAEKIGRPIKIINLLGFRFRKYLTIYLLWDEPKQRQGVDDLKDYVKEFGEELARFTSPGDADTYAQVKAQDFGKNRPDYYAIVVA